MPISWVSEDAPHHPKNITPSSYGLGSLSKSGGSSETKLTNGELSDAKANADSGFCEVPASYLPERAQDRYTNRNWAVVETASKIPSHVTNAEAMAHAPWRHFTAKRFSGDEGDTKEWIEGGVQHSERTWVHPPTHDMALKKQGLTQPLDMTADCLECVNERGAGAQRV